MSIPEKYKIQVPWRDAISYLGDAFPIEVCYRILALVLSEKGSGRTTTSFLDDLCLFF